MLHSCKVSSSVITLWQSWRIKQFQSDQKATNSDRIHDPGTHGSKTMRADSIAKDASTLPQTAAAPVGFSTAKTVIRYHCACKWSRMAKPAVPHATCVNRDQEKDFTPSQRTLLSRLRTGGHTPELAWYCNRITRNQNQLEPATCQQCGQAEEKLVHLMTECPVLEDARSTISMKMIPSLFCSMNSN